MGEQKSPKQYHLLLIACNENNILPCKNVDPFIKLKQDPSCKSLKFGAF